eukprot:5313660-Amphidinium_carterae.1
MPICLPKLHHTKGSLSCWGFLGDTGVEPLIPTRTTATKRRRTQNPQSINRKQPIRSHDEVLGDSEDQETQ